MEKWRQCFHIEPPEGWLNDPNGLCYFDGAYHVYFQYSPSSPEGKNTRCWGHYAGKDLTDLHYEGIVLRPDLPEDRDGVYSGCAVVEEGVLHLFYTGNVKEAGDHDYIRSGRGANVIHVTSADGQTMGEKQVVLRNSDYPAFCSCHVRDPKVWREDGHWKMVLGVRTLEDKGCVLVYRSADLVHWDYVTAVSVPDFGYMWECPDYFETDGKGFLSVSPQGLEHRETQYQNVYQSGYFPVLGKLEDGAFGAFAEWDMGFDFYAPQTFEAPDGRRILLGWMGIGDMDYTNPTTALGWQHCMTLPRELTAGEDGVLLQRPIRELEARRRKERSLQAGELSMPFELAGEVRDGFAISLDEKLHLNWDPAAKLFTLKFTDRAYGGGRTVRRAKLKDCSDFRIIGDTSSLEIYLNGGKTVFSTRFYPDRAAIDLKINGIIAGTMWELA